MSDPVRITNPGAESLGYDSDGHEIMAVDIYVNPPRVDVFHGTPPACVNAKIIGRFSPFLMSAIGH